MNDRDAFIAAIRAHPDEDTPRLAFADWLQENGDEERGAFVRAQVQLGWVDPGVEFWSRWDESARRWRAELPVYDGVTWGKFQRGFVSSVSVRAPADFIAGAADIARAEPITAVQFGMPTGFADLAAVPAMADVRSLHTWFRGHLTDAHLCPLLESPHCPRLYALDVGGQLVTARSMSAVAACPRMGELRVLDVYNNRIHDAGMRALADSPHLGNLRELTAYNNWLSDAGVTALASSAALGGLTRLKLGGAIGPAGVRALATSAHLARLKSLELVDYAAGAEGARALAESANLASLESLSLTGRFDGGNPVGPTGAVALANSPNLRRLRSLTLIRGAIGDTGAVALANSPNLSRLTTLTLNMNHLTDAAVAALVASPYLTALPPRGLHVNGNQITNAGLQAIRARFEPK